MSWNLKFQESIEWKSEVRSDDEYYDEEDSDDFEDEEDEGDEEVDEEDEGDEEVDEDKACSRTKKAVSNQDQPYYHILMVEDGENNPVQHKLNVPEGNLRLMFAFLHHLPTRIFFSCFLLLKNR